jgi:leucyl-tRNA synthetase
MFLGPLEQSKPWSTQGIEGVYRFLKKLWRLFYNADGQLIVNDETPNKSELKSLHKVIKKVGEDIENFSFNTSVSTFMIGVNELTELKCYKKSILSELLICMAPFAPHIAEELWNAIGNQGFIADAAFPIFVPEYLVEDQFNYPISFNGKVKNELVQKWLEGKSPKKIIFVKGKIINIVL